MSNNESTRKFEVCTVPVSKLTPDQVYDEAQQLRCKLTELQHEIAVKRAKANQQGTARSDPNYLSWLVRVRTVLLLVQKRYGEVRTREKALNLEG